MHEVHKNGQSGFTLLSVLMITGVVGLVSMGTYRILDQQVDVLRIVRMQQRMDLVEKRVLNTGRSNGAMRLTSQLNQGSLLATCYESQKCASSEEFEAIDLYDALGQSVSGRFDLNGRHCSEDCALEVATQSRIVCPEGQASCDHPSEIQTRYIIRRGDSTAFHGREFKPRSGLVSLSIFSCPKDQYIRSITNEGHIICDEAYASLNQATCPQGTAAYGIDAEGYLKCAEIVDYCQSPLAIATVLDTSASMAADGAMGKAKAELGNFVKSLRKNEDEASFSSFNSKASMRQDLTHDMNAIVRSIYEEVPQSMTDMVAGLDAGGRTLSHMGGPGQKLMVFVSDGFHNGVGDPVAAAQLLRSQGVRIFTVGLSKKVDVRMLQMIASSPRDYFDATNTSELSKAFNSLTQLTCRRPINSNQTSLPIPTRE